MKKGVIRIISGIVLLVLQVLSIIGSAGANAGGNLGHYIGFYRVRRISLGMTIRPRSSTLLTMPVAFIYLSPFL